MRIIYDGDGNRVAKTVGGTTTYYLLDDHNPSGYVQVLEEWTSTGTPTLSRVYNYGYALISQRQPGVSTNYFVFDGHGSTRVLADIGGNVVNAFAFDAWGNLIASNAAPQTAYLYGGQQFDGDWASIISGREFLIRARADSSRRTKWLATRTIHARFTVTYLGPTTRSEMLTLTASRSSLLMAQETIWGN